MNLINNKVQYKLGTNIVYFFCMSYGNILFFSNEVLTSPK